MFSHISDIYKVNFQCVLPCVFEKLFCIGKFSHILYIHRISPFSEFFCVFAMIFFIWKGFSTLLTVIGFLSSDSFHVFEENWDKGMLFHISDIYKVNLHCVLPCAFEKLLAT